MIYDIWTINKDTVLYAAASHFPFLAELKMYELSKSTWIIVVHGLGISKSLHYRTVKIDRKQKNVILRRKKNAQRANDMTSHGKGRNKNEIKIKLLYFFVGRT